MMKRIVIFQVLLMLFLPTAMAECWICTYEKTNMMEISSDKKTEIEANMRQARNFMGKGDYVSAKKKLLRVLELDEEHAEAQRLLEECNGMIEQQREAEREALQDAIDAGSVKALQDFIAQYPKSEFISQAESCIVDFELWDEARKTDTKAAYQHYLSTSNRLGYKNDAESAIYRIEAEEAWADCHNSNSMTKLESYLDKYSNSTHAKEAEYELNLLKAEKYFNQNSRTLALSYYEKANTYRALIGSHKKNYDELVLEATYDRLKGSTNLTDLQNFLKRLTLDSPYYNPISNRIAVVKAQRLTINSSDMDMDVALSYAKDNETKATVKQYISDVKKRQRENRRDMRKWRRKTWWEDRATLGWSIVTADIDPTLDLNKTNASAFPSTCSLGTGLRLRFGRFNDPVNFTIGADYQNYWGKYVTTTNYYSYYSEENVHYSTIHRRLAFPVNFKVNMPTNKYSKKAFYAGCTAEFGFDINDVSNYFKQINSFESLLNWQTVPSIAVEPQIGFNHKHFDWGLYYRYYIQGYRFFNTEFNDGNTRMGIYMVVYF